MALGKRRLVHMCTWQQGQQQGSKGSSRGSQFAPAKALPIS